MRRMRFNGIVAFGMLSIAACASDLEKDLKAAFSQSKFFANYHGDGTPAGDSAAVIASAAATMLEDGDHDSPSGTRLFREAVRRGVPDSAFYRDGLQVARFLSDDKLYAEVLNEARKRYPFSSWP